VGEKKGEGEDERKLEGRKGKEKCRKGEEKGRGGDGKGRRGRKDRGGEGGMCSSSGAKSQKMQHGVTHCTNGGEI